MNRDAGRWSLVWGRLREASSWRPSGYRPSPILPLPPAQIPQGMETLRGGSQGYRTRYRAKTLLRVMGLRENLLPACAGGPRESGQSLKAKV